MNTSTTSFTTYLKRMLKIVVSSSLTLALLIAIAILLVGSASGDLEFDVDIERIDALWVLLGLPIIATLLFTILSPISYWISRWLVDR
jgi:putative flippase GtrA